MWWCLAYACVCLVSFGELGLNRWAMIYVRRLDKLREIFGVKWRIVRVINLFLNPHNSNFILIGAFIFFSSFFPREIQILEAWGLLLVIKGDPFSLSLCCLRLSLSVVSVTSSSLGGFHSCFSLWSTYGSSWKNFVFRFLIRFVICFGF